MKSHQLAATMKKQRRAGYTLHEIFDQWLEREQVKVTSGRKRQASLVTDLSALKHVLNFFDGVDLNEINHERIEDYQAHRKTQGVKATTINTEGRKLKALLNWCFEKRLIDHQPKFDPLPEPPVDTEVLTSIELGLILAKLPERYRILFRLMAETGLRKSEARRLQWDDIDLQLGRIKLGAQGKETPKTQGSYRTVGVGELLLSELKALKLKRISPWLFPSIRDPAKHIVDIRKSLATAVKSSGVLRHGKPIKFTPKYARKAFSSYLLLANTPLPIIKKRMGHSANSRVTEKHYLHMPEDAILATDFQLDIPENRNEYGNIWQLPETTKGHPKVALP